MKGFVAASVLLAAPACASTSPRHDFADVARTVESRSGGRVRFEASTDSDRQADAAVDRLLGRELDVDGAVQVALLASPSLQATFEELAISRADLVQAGLLHNPSFTVGRTAWEMEHIAPNLFASVEQDFLDVVTLPLRKRVAATELEAKKLEIADDVLEVAAEVRTAYFEAVAAEQLVRMRRLVDEASATSAELARRQHAAGNMNDLGLGSELALASQASVDRKRAEGDATVARERLVKKMGLWGPRTGFRLAPRLPELPASEASLERLESRAIDQRLDLAAARRTVQSMGYALGLARTTRWTGSVTVGVEAGRLRRGKHLAFGPSVTLEIPLFDQRQTRIAKLEAYARQSERELRALAIDIRADVRAARARLVASRSVAVEYATVLVPTRESVVRHAQEQYDAMLLGVYQLIQAKQAEYDAYRAYVEALRDYWIARSDLERAVGGRLDAREAHETRDTP